MEQTLHEFLDEQEGVQDEGFKVDTEEKANWALRKLRKIEEQKQEDVALAESEIEKIETWLDQKKEKYQRDTDYFQGLLAAYAMEKRQADPEFKSLKLPNGRIRFKKQQPAYKYDDSALIESLKNQGRHDLIKVKESPDKANLKKKYKVIGERLVDPKTGEVLDGVTVEEREDKFEVGIE